MIYSEAPGCSPGVVQLSTALAMGTSSANSYQPCCVQKEVEYQFLELLRRGQEVMSASNNDKEEDKQELSQSLLQM